MKEELLTKVKATFDDWVKSLNGVSPDDTNKIPFEGSWTFGQTNQHMILSCSGFVTLINGPEAEANRPMDQNVAQTKAILEGDEKMKSPPFIEPEMKVYDHSRFVKKVGELKIAMVSAIEKNDLAKLATGFDLGNGYMTKFEAASFMLYHTRRHVKQLQNITRHLHTA